MSRLALASLFLLAACHSVTPLEPLFPGKAIRGYPRKIEVTHMNGSKEILHSPTVVGDSLIGYRKSREIRDSLRVALPLTDVWRVGEREFSGGRTVAVVAGGTFAVGLVFVMIVAATLSTQMSHKS